MHSVSRAGGDVKRARREGVPALGAIEAVRAVITGHDIQKTVRRTANVWHIDTGAGMSHGALTIARIDTDPIETVTVCTGH